MRSVLLFIGHVNRSCDYHAYVNTLTHIHSELKAFEIFSAQKYVMNTNQEPLSFYVTEGLSRSNNLVRRLPLLKACTSHVSPTTRYCALASPRRSNRSLCRVVWRVSPFVEIAASQATQNALLHSHSSTSRHRGRDARLRAAQGGNCVQDNILKHKHLWSAGRKRFADRLPRRHTAGGESLAKSAEMYQGLVDTVAAPFTPLSARFRLLAAVLHRDGGGRGA